MNKLYDLYQRDSESKNDMALNGEKLEMHLLKNILSVSFVKEKTS